jgi:hypothetical protein
MPNEFLPKASDDVTKIRRQTWNRLSDVVNGGATSTAGFNGGGRHGNWVRIKNTSGSDRDRFDCMQLSTLAISLTTDGRVDPVFNAITAAADKTPCVLLEPIANNQFGRAVVHGFALAKLASGTATLTTASPNAAAHNLKPDASGSIKLLAAPSASAVTLCPVLLGTGGGGEKFYLYKLTTAMGATSGTANIYNLENNGVFPLESGLIATGATLYDTVDRAASQVTNQWGICVARGQAYYVVIPACVYDTPPTSGA